MKNLGFILSACLLTLVGCAPQAVDGAQVDASSQAVTQAECDADRDACRARWGFLGLLTCETAYLTCSSVAEAEEVVDQVGDTAEALAECATNFDGCLSTPINCVTENVDCAAGVLEVNVPTVVEDSIACVTASEECVSSIDPQDPNAAEEIALCGELLVECSIAEALEVVPDEVAEPVGNLLGCEAEQRACIQDNVGNPAGTAQCVEDFVACTGGALDVDLPDVPLTELVECADLGLSCGTDQLEDIDAGALLECSNDFATCAAEVAEELAQPVLTCAEKRAQCIDDNGLFGFLFCPPC